jgi:alpha-tubulin suppressor-like RCC1 family protein
MESTYLVDAFGTLVADDDELSLYVQCDGVLHVMLGNDREKEPPNAVIQWGYDSLQSTEIIKPRLINSVFQARVVSVDCGWLHTAVALECGAALAWGNNNFGQLGTGNEIKSAEPVLCKMSREVRLCKVVCGSYFTVAIDDKGELWSWGRYQSSNWPGLFTETWANGYDKQGDKGIKGEKILAVAAGESHVACAMASGKLFSWGYNEHWQLGWGQNEAYHHGQQKPREVKLPGLSTINPISALSCGGLHTAAALRDGKLFAWGSNSEGQLGHVLRKCFGRPQGVTSMEHEHCASVACGRYSTLCTTESHCSYFWGSLIGSKDPEISVSDPLQTETAHCTNEASECKFSGVATSRVLAGAAKQLLGTEVNSGTVGEAHGILLLRNGMVRGWGYNAYGQALGHVNNKTDIVDEPTQCDLGDTYNPSSEAKILKMCTSGGMSTFLVSSTASGALS